MSLEAITISELVQLGEVVVIDVREPDEYQDGHIPGALNFPLSTIDQTFADIPDHEKLYFVCHVGGRSARVCEFLSMKESYANKTLTNVLGGTNGWIIEGHEVVTGVQPI